MDFEIHSPDRPYIENAGYFDRNQIPKANQRTGHFWDWCRPWLGLPERPSLLVDKDDGAQPFIASLDGGGMIFGGRMSDDARWEAMRRREAAIAALNGPKPPTPLQAIAGDLADMVKDTVKRLTKTDKAKAWLAGRLQQGPVDATTIEAEGRNAGFTLKLLKIVKKRLRVVSVRKGANNWRWQLPMATKAKGANE